MFGAELHPYQYLFVFADMRFIFYYQFLTRKAVIFFSGFSAGLGLIRLAVPSFHCLPFN
jgi:hypothetical protein